MDLKKDTLKCEKCGSKKVVPIFYGYPTTKEFNEYERGEIELGGLTSDLTRKWHCKKCKNRF
ncbi:MAG TPA: hypothetical protein PKK55_02750 [Methanofastidiosum sp.]|nr:hypothetical protein [Methanofastidiosum sp.]HNZ87424.1 hypothetical protein [Methanofastidiosum sp.]HOC78045.1 hypothetical protein [Methanofastidiosum sp.]HOG73822.1 hypothetical protein [Methanofastidiosum sp.]HPA49349.1 hypothetical protein [Methanofastidiosum sp.]